MTPAQLSPGLLKEAARVAAGPVVVATCLLLRAPTISGSSGEATTPLLALLLLIPALYVGAALTSLAPPATTFLRALWAALGDLSTVLLGLSPALAFLLATTVDDRVVIWAGAPVILLGVSLGLRSLFVGLFDESARPNAARLLFVSWALVALAVGARLCVVIWR